MDNAEVEGRNKWKPESFGRWCQRMVLNEGSRTNIDKHVLKWSACMMVRNEEEMVADTISCIRNQTIPPTRIHVLNDGSTDSTGQILDGMDDVIVTRSPPHPPEHSDIRHITKRHAIMYEAAKGMDYILCMDADVYIPPDYMKQITERMGLDNVAVACGTDLITPKMWPIEAGMVIDAKWLNTHPKLPKYSITHLTVESALDGHLSIAYRNIPLRYKRPLGTHYGSDVLKFRGMHQRMYGLSFWWALAVYLRHRKWSFFWGYVSYKGDKLSKRHGQYMNRQFIANVKRKLGLKQQLLLDTKIGIFILPENHTRCPTFLYGV